MLCFHKFHSDDGMTGFRLGLLHGGTSEFDPIRIEDVTGMMQELPDFGECLLENFAVSLNPLKLVKFISIAHTFRY